MTVKETDNKQKDGRHKLTGPGPGRPKGSENKFTNLKKDFLQVYEDIGGPKELKRWVKESKRNQAMFYQWITKMLPTSLVGEQDDKGEFKPLKVIVTSDGNK